MGPAGLALTAREGWGPGSCLPSARSPEQVGACAERLPSLVWKETGPVGLGGCFLGVLVKDLGSPQSPRCSLKGCSFAKWRL